VLVNKKVESSFNCTRVRRNDDDMENNSWLQIIK
jgi:hypothetical protein